MLTKKYFLISNKLVPMICGASSTIGNEGSDTQYSEPLQNSSDILFMQIALGEGPVYRINPTGPQDIEIDDYYIDDLVDLDKNETKPNMFATASFNGTLNQPPLTNFFSSFSNKIYFDNPKILRSGVSTNTAVTAAPFNSVDGYPTTNEDSLTPIDSIKFLVEISSLANGSDPGHVGITTRVFDPDTYSGFDGDFIAENQTRFDGFVESPRTVSIEVPIPDSKKLPGYLVSVRKTTPDVTENPNFKSQIQAIGFEEVRGAYFSYPRTASVGYAIKSSELRGQNIPNFTSGLKGLIIDVPSNYNQPVLASGEVDWREIEIPEGDVATSGYSTQQDGDSTSTDINIYKGVWDGTFKKDWTQNPVWIIYAILTNTDWGLGLPASAIDKFNFYNIAQYCDAVDASTGNFVGVDGLADGSFRYKPRGFASLNRLALVGLTEGTLVKERRFVCDITISDVSDGLAIIDTILAGMRGTLVDSGGKLSIVVDRENQTPVAYFNETNIVDNSFSVSGVRQEELVSGVEVSYIDFANHFKKTTLVEDDPSFDEVFSQRSKFDLSGCTRKGQALRFAKYILNTSKKVKRRVKFSATHGANDLQVGDIISVSNKVSGLNYGFGGQISSNSVLSESNVYLEHFTSPSIDSSVFTANTSPLLLKVFTKENNRLSQYILSNTDYAISSDNASIGASDIRVTISNSYDSDIVSSFSGFSANNIPVRGDLWALGEISSNSPKNFRVESVARAQDGLISIVATEYVESVFSASETLSQDDVPPVLLSSADYLRTPPVPSLFTSTNLFKNNEGIVFYGINLSRGVDVSSYTSPVRLDTTLLRVPEIVEIEI